MKNIVCEEKGKKIKYEAKDALEIKYDTSFYEAGLIRLKKLRSKQYVFLNRTIKGKLNLYEISVKRTRLLMKNFGEDLIHGRMIYRAQDWYKNILVTVYFYKKENEPRKNFTRSWKEKTRDCKLLHDKINSKTTPWNPPPGELVRFYNMQCR